jgi:hypothetical protein
MMISFAGCGLLNQDLAIFQSPFSARQNRPPQF